METVSAIVNHKTFQRVVVGVILVNALALGLLTLDLPPGTRALVNTVDDACLAFFVVEIALKLATLRGRFFRDGWNVFDLGVVAIALVPQAGPLGVLRSLRVLRLMRMITIVPSLRRVIAGMFVAIPGGASVAGVLLVMYYVAAIIGYNLFGQTVPQHFGSIGTTFFTLFKMMTLEGWPDIASEVLPFHPQAWIFFVIFIIFTTFTTLNLLFGIIVDAMEQAKEVEVREKLTDQGVEITGDSPEMRLAVLHEEVRQIRAMLEEMRARPDGSAAAG